MKPMMRICGWLPREVEIRCVTAVVVTALACGGTSTSTSMVMDGSDLGIGQDEECVPNCEGAVCGDDGCGGSCGSCSPRGICYSGACCEPGVFSGAKTEADDNGVVWVAIPPGCFRMGCSVDDRNCFEWENPAHQVSVSGFAMTETEVTEAQYQAIMGTNPSCHPEGSGGPNGPVECVTWAEAKAFCEALGGRLPTEAEWEYAARGGGLDPFGCGSGMTCPADIAWYQSNSQNHKHDVKGKNPNGFEIYDTVGNVFEWTADWQGDYAEGLETNPSGPETGKNRIVRGGDFGNFYDIIRVSNRYGYLPTKRFEDVGIRCVKMILK